MPKRITDADRDGWNRFARAAHGRPDIANFYTAFCALERAPVWDYAKAQAMYQDFLVGKWPPHRYEVHAPCEDDASTSECHSTHMLCAAARCVAEDTPGGIVWDSFLDVHVSLQGEYLVPAVAALLEAVAVDVQTAHGRYEYLETESHTVEQTLMKALGIKELGERTAVTLAKSLAQGYLDAVELAERLKLEAKIHAQEARTANATIYEIYQAVSDATGEPGNWHGAQPVKDKLSSLEQEVARLREALAFTHSTNKALQDHMGKTRTPGTVEVCLDCKRRWDLMHPDDKARCPGNDPFQKRPCPIRAAQQKAST